MAAMATSLFWGLALASLAAPGRGMTIQAYSNRTMDWMSEVNTMLTVEGIENPEKKTAVVTFAGKRNVEYIDGAVMLAMSIQKHLPGFPMVALVIEDMKEVYQQLLQNAGYTLVVVPNWDKEYCGVGCDLEFLGRWHDSFEKINTFRLPFDRVLFLDSDTYVFSDRIQDLLNNVQLPDGHIAMAMDGCKDEFNSGVMFFRPKLDTFMGMLRLVGQRSREQILDQNIINAMYKGRVVEISRDFNCVDTLGIQPGLKKACDIHCSPNVVVAHFTGHPKPTSPKRRLLELVRRPGSPAIACTNTNFGSCAKWSEYYCDIRRYQHNLSKNLQFELHKTGDCCHSPFNPTLDKETCKECPASLKIKGDERTRHSGIDGLYVKTNLKPRKYNGGKPIYINKNSNMKEAPMYLYYIQKQVIWLIGSDYSNNNAVTYAGKEAQCPRDAGAWHFWTGEKWEMRPLAVKPTANHGAPRDTEHVVWNVKRRRWEEEEQGAMDFDKDEKDA